MAPWRGRVILVVCISFFSRLNITTLGVGNDHGNTWIWKDSNEVFSHFFQHKNYALRVNSIGSFLVGFVTECALRCLRHLSCVSFNIEEATAANKRHVTCELLPVDMYNASEKLQSSENFHHWSTVTPYLHSPCKNGGTCVVDYKRGLYDCLCKTNYHGKDRHLIGSALGRTFDNPGRSCKDIAEKQSHPQGDGEYWIAPEISKKPFIVYCDMTTDGGGWTLLKRTVVSANLSTFWSKSTTVSSNYTSIGNYWDNFLFVSIRAIEELRQAARLNQLRWYCYKKKQGSVFHVMTKSNSAGHWVLDYLLNNPSSNAPACNSFDRLSDDNSTLSQICHKWGFNSTHSEINEWGSYKHKGERRLYQDVSGWKDGERWFSFRPPFELWCDDHGGMATISQGDTWEVYAR